MNLFNIFSHLHLKKLLLFVTLLTPAAFISCSSLKLTPEDTCNSRAYIRTPLDSYIKQRYPYGAPVRLGIIPFTAPAGIAYLEDQLPGVGHEIARNLQRELLSKRAVTITEVLNRLDWPGQRMEFYHGNHRSIRMAKDAGYDLVFIGLVDTPTSVDQLVSHGKLIDVESGVTVWNGMASVSTTERTYNHSGPAQWWAEHNPNKLPTRKLTANLAACMVTDVLKEEVVPE